MNGAAFQSFSIFCRTLQCVAIVCKNPEFVHSPLQMTSSPHPPRQQCRVNGVAPHFEEDSPMCSDINNRWSPDQMPCDAKLPATSFAFTLSQPWSREMQICDDMSRPEEKRSWDNHPNCWNGLSTTIGHSLVTHWQLVGHSLAMISHDKKAKLTDGKGGQQKMKLSLCNFQCEPIVGKNKQQRTNRPCGPSMATMARQRPSN